MKIALTSNSREFSDYLEARMPRILQLLVAKLDSLSIRLQQKIVTEKMSGQVLHHRSGGAIRSIRVIPATLTTDGVAGGVQGGGETAPYLIIQEKGGTRTYDIFPVNKKALAFMFQGKQIFAKHVVHPPLPARPVMAPSLEEMKPTIVTEIQQTINQGLQK